MILNLAQVPCRTWHRACSWVCSRAVGLQPAEHNGTAAMLLSCTELMYAFMWRRDDPTLVRRPRERGTAPDLVRQPHYCGTKSCQAILTALKSGPEPKGTALQWDLDCGYSTHAGGFPR